MYLTPSDKHWACDIETDGLADTYTEIFCVTLINVVTKEELDFTSAATFHVWWLSNPEAILVGHNFLSFDANGLAELWGTLIPVSRIVDTYVLSMLYNPNLRGGHSLRVWGQRLKYEKIDFHDFTRFSPEMLKYCRRDTRLAALLFLRLTERMRKVGFTEVGAAVEHLSWHIIQNKQKRNGFPFDVKKAEILYAELSEREAQLQKEIYALWPPTLQCVRHFAKARLKDGSFSGGYRRHLGQYIELKETSDGGYDAFDYVEFNLGSPPQRIAKLLELGWKPVNKTKGGSPKVDEDELLAFAEKSGKKEVAALAKWIVVNARARMVKTWLNSVNEKTGAIHGSLLLNATLRYKHNSPNSANIPAVKTKKVDGKDVVLYGEEGTWCYECRDLWTAGGEGWKLVGIDGKGIQLRCLAHNVAKMVGLEEAAPFFARVLDGDPHTHNIKVLGLANKPAAKKFLYTTLMGGGGAKLASDQAQFGTHLTAADGNRLKNLLISSVPGFKELINALLEQMARQQGRITLCDGTPIIVPSDHMVIPYLLQGDESRLMKQASIYLDEEIEKRGHSKLALKAADIHDEWQYRVHESIVDEFIEYALPCFIRAGEFFGYLIPIEGDAKVGETWAETH